MGVATPAQPDSTVDTGTQYKADIDAAAKVASRFTGWFAPHENDAGSPALPDMTVRLDSGFIWNGAATAAVAAQSTGTIAAPSGNPRIDLVVVDAQSGAASVVTGSESASPSAPAVPSGKIPVAQVALAVSQTTIENTDITDARVFPLPPPVTTVEAQAGTETAARTWSPDDVAAAVAALANSNADSVRLGHAVLAGQAATLLELYDGVADAFGDTAGVDAANSTNEIRFSAGYYKGLTASGGNAIQDSKTGSNSTTLDATRPHGGIRWTQSGAGIALGIRADFHAVGTAGNVSARMYVAGTSTIVAQSADVAVSATGEIDFVFTAPYVMSDGVDYVIALRRDTGSYTLSTVTAPGTDVTFSALATTEIHSIVADSNMDGSEDLRMGVLLGNVANLTLTGESYAAGAVPAAGALHVQVIENESITVNTDLLADMSRDDGSTWETGTLALLKTLASGAKVYKAADIDLSGQPSGTTIRHRVRTANTKDIEIHAIVSDVR